MTRNAGKLAYTRQVRLALDICNMPYTLEIHLYYLQFQTRHVVYHKQEANLTYSKKLFWLSCVHAALLSKKHVGYCSRSCAKAANNFGESTYFIGNVFFPMTAVGFAALIAMKSDTSLQKRKSSTNCTESSKTLKLSSAGKYTLVSKTLLGHILFHAFGM